MRGTTFSIRRVGLAISGLLILCGSIGLFFLSRPLYHMLLFGIGNEIEDTFLIGLILLFALLATYPKAWWARIALSLFTAFLILALCLPRI
jgi:hypothetical protein